MAKFSKGMGGKCDNNKKYVKIVLHKATNLPVMDTIGASDPYVKVTCGNETLKSKTVKRSLNPNFKNEELYLYIDTGLLLPGSDPKKSLILVEVYDWDLLSKDDYIGSVVIDLHSLPRERAVHNNYRLDGKKGELEFTITAYNFGITQSDYEKCKNKLTLLTLDNSVDAVMKKIKGSLYGEQFKKKEDMLKFASILSDIEKMKSTYLNTKWTSTLVMEKEIEDVSKEGDTEDDENDEESSEASLATNAQGKQTEKLLSSSIPIKLVIMDQDQENAMKKNVRKFFSPILSTLDLIPQMGMFHSALMIGPWLIEWNNSSLCVPRKCVSKAALISADIDAIATLDDLNDLIDKLAYTIVKWNTSMYYQTKPSGDQKYGNCQEFVEALLNHIGVQIKFDGPLAKFLQRLRENGNCELKYEMSADFRTKFNISKKDIVFATHEELDGFVGDLLLKDAAFKTSYPLEYQFLKSIDRAFWIRNFKVRDMVEKCEKKSALLRMKIQQTTNEEAKKKLEESLNKNEKEKMNYIASGKDVRPRERKIQKGGQVIYRVACPFGDPEATAAEQMNHSYDYTFKHSSRKGKVPYTPTKLEPVKLPPIIQDVLEVFDGEKKEHRSLTRRAVPGLQKDAPPTKSRKEKKTSSPHPSRSKAFFEMKTSAAPDDEEEISKLKTGEDAVAFFSRARKSAAVKFVYLNRTDAYDKSEKTREYRPYDLTVVPQAEIFPEYYTMSATGVVHFHPSNPTEFMSLSEWMKESTLFNVLRRIRFFKYYLVQKCFILWYKNSRFRKYCKKRVKLARKFFAAKNTFVPSLKQIYEHCYEAETVQVMVLDMGSNKGSSTPYTVEKFLSKQQEQRKEATRRFNEKVDKIEQILIKLIESVQQSANVPSMTHDNIEAYLKGTANVVDHEDTFKSKKSKSMVKAQQEEEERKRALKKAKEEADMLGEFVRLCDYMIVESLISVAKEGLVAFKQNLYENKNILFKIILTFREDNEMVFEPDEKDLLEMFRRNSEDIVYTINTIHRVLQKRAFKQLFQSKNKSDEESNMKLWNVSKTLYTDLLFANTQMELENMLRTDFGAVLVYSKRFEGVKVWYQFQNDWNPEEYSSKLHSVAEFSLDINKVDGAVTELQDRMGVSHESGILFVDSKSLQNVLVPKMKEILEQIKVTLISTLKETCINLHQEFKQRVKAMQDEPVKLKDFAMFVDNLNKIKSKSRELVNQAEEIEKMYELAMRKKVNISTEDSVLVDQLKEIRDEFLVQIGKAEEFKENNIPDRTQELEENINQVNQELLNTMAHLRQGIYIDKDSDPAQVLEKLAGVQETLEIVEEKTKTYQEYQVLFNTKAKEWSSLQDIRKIFDSRLDIWQTIDDFQKKTETWDETDIKNLDTENMEKEVQTLFAKATKLHRVHKDEVTEYLKQQVLVWKEKMPVIVMMGNKNLKQNHREEIFAVMGNEMAKDGYLTLRHLETFGIYNYKDLVARVSAKASGEAELQKKLDKIDDQWKEMEFVVNPYRNKKGVYILGSAEEIIQLLEDNQMTLQTMQASPYIEGVKNKVTDWEKKLTMLSEILEEWFNCQRNWMYLEFIFSSEDIKRQLHDEAAKFANVDKEFKDIMNKTFSNKSVLSVVTDDEVLTTLVNCNKILEEVQKKMEDFLETKREAFPRFFFLSNDELLEILSQTREPRAVQPHLSKCFDNIKSLQFKEEGSPEIVGMNSAEEEHVPFSEAVVAEGNVEFWLLAIEDMMRKTVHSCMKQCLKDYTPEDRNDWFFQYPAQCILTVDQIIWTKDVTQALLDVETSKDKNAVNKYYQQYIAQIEKMVELVRRTDLHRNHRRTLNSLLVVDVHARDVIENIINSNCSSVTDFEWLMQLRYYWEQDNCIVKQSDATFYYGFEYLGNTPRLVITPLTDRCFMTCTGALHLKLGAAPQGPAGTGKTESVKDLAKALARQCVVFNCSEGLKVKMMSQMFAGLAQAGAWACFDEFNRIDIEVLSVIAQYMRNIQRAIIAEKSHFLFDDRDISLNPNYGVFITMNPGYAGRTELPDNLKALFRPVAMMIPDYALIAEIMLFSEGFTTAKVLAQKMAQLFKLSSEQLSKQDHYDFGMRAVKSILVRAGALKRGEPNLQEEIVLIRSMRDSNVPKFLEEDVVLFNAIIQDLFPNVKIPDVDYGMVKTQIEENLVKNNFQPLPPFVKKIIQLHETMIVRHGVMLVGATGTGKTVAYNALKDALTQLHEKGYKEDNFMKVIPYVLNPKSITMQEMYGEVNELSHEWHDGLVAKIARNAVKEKENSSHRHWIVFDGPVDALWIENMNTVLDDNKMLCLTNGQRIKLPDTISLLFEVQDLAVASPATVSRCGMVYMQTKNLNGVWKPIFSSWKLNMEARLEGRISRLDYLIDHFIEPTLIYIRSNCEEFIKSVDSNLVTSLLRLLEAFYTPKYGVDPNNPIWFIPRATEEVEDNWETAEREVETSDNDDENSEDGKKAGDDEVKEEINETLDNLLDEDDEGIKIDIDRMIDLYFVFAYIWSLGANVSDNYRNEFSNFARGLISQIMPDFPESGLVYNYFVSIEHQCFKPWDDAIPSFKYNPSKPYFNILVPTVDTYRVQYLCKASISVNQHILVTGVSGVGKTVVIHELLREQLKSEVPESDFVSATINLSAQTTSKNLQEIMEEKLESKRKNLLGPPNNKKALLFIDDINMPKPEEYGAQPPLELIRQTIDQGGFYDRQKYFFKNVTDTIFLAACAPPGGGRKEVTPRLLRHFYMINFPDLDSLSMRKIFNSILSGFLTGFSEPIESIASGIVDASIDIFTTIKKKLLPRPSTSHYTFNLRDIGKLFQGILQIGPEQLKSQDDIIHLWLHEGSRVFKDRLVNFEDKSWFTNIQSNLLRRYFNKNWEQENFKDILFADFLRREEKVYEKVEDLDALAGVLSDYLVDYNLEKNTDLNLVFFKDAIDHVCRICRIIRQPRGSALLVGVGGSGRHCLTRLAAYMTGSVCKEIEITRNFKLQQFRDSLKEMMLLAGCGTEKIPIGPVVFLISDTQIIDESMLEDIHNLLNTGEVANIFEHEEMEQIFTQTRKHMASLGKKAETRDTILRHFTHYVRENLHIILCMSPIGDSFRNRLRMFPSLVNNCTIDWFTGWPEEALFSVSRNLLSNIDLLQEDTKLLNSVSNMCVYVHSSVTKISEKFLRELRRHNYTTPTSYLELLNLYISMLSDQRFTIAQQLERLRKGLEKLKETNEGVAVMKEDLKKKQPILDEKVKQTQKLSVELAADKEKADEVRAICIKEEKECQEIMDKAQMIKDDCQTDLDAAIPVYNAALQALDAINRDDIYAIKGMKRPPDLVKIVMSAVCVLFGKPATWEESLKVLTDPALISKLVKYEKDNIPKDRLKKLQEYIKMPNFTPDAVKKVSISAKSLCMWVIAVDGYSKVMQKIEPKREKLKEAETELEKAKKVLSEKQASLYEIEKKVEILQQNLQDAEDEKKNLQEEIKRTEQRLERAEKLLAGLSGERVRWEKQAQDLEKNTSTIVGDILLAAGSVSYLGPFTATYRTELSEMWKKKAQEFNIPVNISFSLSSIADPVKVREWISNGLPTDNFSIDNAILVQRGRRWPLMIDPQGQANKWIRATERMVGLKIIKATDPEILRKIEPAVQYGLPAMIENVGEEIDPSLEPLLLKQTYKLGGADKIRLGDKDIEYNAAFRLYLTTKLPNPHFMPEVCTKVAVINFTVTLGGLEDQLLADVVRNEQPDLERDKNNLVVQISEGKNQLKEIEDKILGFLSKQSEVFILDDIELIQALNDSKVMSEKIQTSVQKAEETAERIDAAREQYRPAAKRGSILFFVIADMAGINPMYQNSLAFFKNLFNQCLAKSERSDDIKTRLDNMINFVTETTYRIICRGLFEEDKLLFSLLMTTQILRAQAIIHDTEWNFFLRGSAGQIAADEKPAKWIPDSLWNELSALCKLSGYEELPLSFASCFREWQEFFESDDPHNRKLPENWDAKLSQWRKTLLLKALRQEKLVFCVTKLVTFYLGPKFADSPPFDLSNAFTDTTAQTPTIFVLSPGADPQSIFDAFAASKKYSEKVLTLSLGQGQGKKAAVMIQQAQATGEWVFLQNCHLAVSWMPELERYVEELGEKKNIHPDFRLWLTSMPNDKFPVPVLQGSIKLTNEPPKGLKANVKRCFYDMKDKFFEMPSKTREWKKLIFGLVFFHSLIQERKKFGSLGWNIPYEWNDSDLDASMISLRNLLQQQSDVPWQALRYTIGVIHYGGRVTDFLDLKCVECILKKFFSVQILSDSHTFVEGQSTYFAPNEGTLAEMREYISGLPAFEEPELFGLHQNANITFQHKETFHLLESLISIQPRTSTIHGGRSGDEIVLQIVSDLTPKVPPHLDISKAHTSCFEKTEDGTINTLGTFLSQEVISFNKLLDVIINSLLELEKAIKGFALMSTELEVMYHCFLNQKVPQQWHNAAYPSRKPLSAWFSDLCNRVEFLRKWIIEGQPSSFWICSFFFPQGFLTAVLQRHARRFRIPIDVLKFKANVLTSDEQKEIETSSKSPDIGVYIYGLFVEGAQWEKSKKCIVESRKGELFTPMPWIWLEPILKEKMSREEQSKLYQCPVYKTAGRAGALSTTGISTNFVISLDLHPGNQSPDHWTQRGVALLCQTE